MPAPAMAEYLHPGHMVVTSEPVVITTILGSCVAVCLWHAESGVAGINHFLLPRNPAPGNADARYGDTATEALIAAVWKRGAEIDGVVAKIFGGASVIAGFTGSRKSIGEQNVAVARRILHERGIAIASEETGGPRGRKLLFDAAGGSAWVREL